MYPWTFAWKRLIHLFLPMQRQTHSTKPVAGTRLMREWRGQTHVVDVLEKSFLYQGKSYRSLSQVAGAITGARWSGPRFFGL